MSNKKQTGRSALVLVLVFAVFALALTGLNSVAAPLIESNGSAAQLAPLYSVMPEAKGFEMMYDAADPAASALHDVPAEVLGIYAESSGMGYALRLSSSEGYTKEPIELTMAVDAEGRIAGLDITAYPETKDVGASYTAAYLGQDSALGEVSLVAGVTYSSSAIKKAVSAGFEALIANELVGEGVKGDGQILEELMPLVFTGMANPSGVAQYEEQDISAAGYTYIVKSMKALSGGGAACIVMDGERSYLAMCNASLICRVIDVEGGDVTDAVPAALVDEVKGAAAALVSTDPDRDISKLSKMVGEGAEISPVELEGVYSCVTGAYRIVEGDAVSYGFVVKSLGFSNMPMVTYYIIDADGTMAAMNADEIILEAEYFNSYTLDEPAYKSGFAGLTADSWSGEQAIISGATMSSNAIKLAVDDAFAAFEIISQNGGEGA